MAKELLPHILQWILRGLQDGDDDVRAVAAAALLPVADDLGTAYQEEVRLFTDILFSYSLFELFH